MSLLSQNFITLIIGNSRLHWGYFQNRQLITTWNTNHLEKAITDLPTALFPREVIDDTSSYQGDNFIKSNNLFSVPIPPSPPFIKGRSFSEDWGDQFSLNNLPVYIASVVSKQTQLWDDYPHKKIITLEDIPLTNTYATLGVDRALCVYGAGETYGYPVLVIDGGTALTYTAVGKEYNFLGGAILPGLRLQLRALNQNTAALPQVSLPDTLPQLWGDSTKSAIASGVIHTIISGIDNYLTAWWEQFPQGKVILTGGDGLLLQQFLQEKSLFCGNKTLVDQTLMFQGMAKLITNHLCRT
ncbi:pantothenate kinase [Euhalothece natronophila Z-M001]|uniref:Type III pantothenate kinase n=1 Tax=Euhalothece natronophila Z-M001 TaxID=522448 RepID=A0A5B8NNA1_9CHRO|nr:pantothenate kinase [Euhalothece natronophila]QDZ39639.1 pantothenate kinase [Euhalothece natronophila Z-M001]